ncbi:N-acetylneuraminate synthase family protein [Gammaproteobacteria bacterium]|nr:N-acetylneuraminate synthase family protein [Gammaproteobacteria bacterium]
MKTPFVIAEIAQAHDGNLNIAHSFIDAVSQTKAADAIKFQTHLAEEESSPSENWRKKFSNLNESRFEYWKRMEFDIEEWRQLKKHCDDVGLEFISSPFSIKAAQMLNSIGMQTWKIASGEVTNLPLIDYIASIKNQRFIISTGLCNAEELQLCLDAINQYDNQVDILSCVSKYPSPLEEIDLDLMLEMKTKYGVGVGLSDHSASIYPCLAAYTLGATVLEVHVTFHKDFFGPDNPASLSLEELKELRNGLTQLESIVHKKAVSDINNLEVMRSLFLKSIIINTELPKGSILKMEDLAFKKPGNGISASQYKDIIGCKLINSKSKGDLLTKKDLEKSSL